MEIAAGQWSDARCAMDASRSEAVLFPLVVVVVRTSLTGLSALLAVGVIRSAWSAALLFILTCADLILFAGILLLLGVIAALAGLMLVVLLVGLGAALLIGGLDLVLILVLCVILILIAHDNFLYVT